MPWSTITCPECGAENLDSELVCVRCNADLRDVEAAGDPIRTAPKVSIESQQENEDDRDEGTSLRSAFLLESPTDPSPRPGASEEGPFSRRSNTADSPRPTADEVEGRRVPRTRRADARPWDGDDEKSLDPNQIEAITNYGRGRPIISVIGFPKSGKSFLVNRLRHLALTRGDWKATPPAESIPLSPEGIELTSLVSARDGWTRRHRKYVVMDCAGESFMQAFERIGRDQALEGISTRSYLAAAGLASAYVLVLRAEDLLGDDGAADHDVTDLAHRFYEIVGGILASRKRLRSESPETLLQRGISREEMQEAHDSHVRCPVPLCVIFAQADRVEGRLSNGTGFDHDPYRFAYHHARILFQAVRNSFPRHRFEFVSAFYGQPDHELTARYELPSYGVADVFDWIDRQVAPRPPLIGPMLRVAEGGVPTGWAVRLRRWLDRDFREAGA